MSIASLVTDWGGFEKLVAKLHETGAVTVEHNVVLTGRSGAPRQIDVVIRHKQGLYDHLVVAECKFWNSKVERAHVDELARTVQEVGASRGVIFSTKGFQSGAVTQAKHDAIDLFTVRDLTDEEWGLPGRIVDFFLQVIQLSIGEITSEGAGVIGATATTEPVNLNFEFGADGPVSATPTLKRDGVTLGPSLEQYISDAIHQSVQSLKTFTINGGAECTRYMLRPVNILPTTPFMLPMKSRIVVIPKIACKVGLKIAQSRITVDRAAQYQFAFAVENCVNGVVSSASRARNELHSTVAELVQETPNPSGEAVLTNGSVMRVLLKALFPFEEMARLEPGPHYNHL
jgi:restriction endonuclease